MISEDTTTLILATVRRPCSPPFPGYCIKLTGFKQSPEGRFGYRTVGRLVDGLLQGKPLLECF